MEDLSHVPTLGQSGLDADLPPEVAAIQQQARKFAIDVIRPLARDLDAMSAADMVAQGSPIHDFFVEVQRIGLIDLGAMAQTEPAMQALILPVLMEELGTGDAGLSMLSLARDFVRFLAIGTGNQEVIGRLSNGFGCFLATQPDRGSDAIDHRGLDNHPGSRRPIGNLTVKRDGDDFIVNGQSSAWVSGAPLAAGGIAYAACDFGDGFYDSSDRLNLIGILIPFDEAGVTKGPPLEKLGQRPLPQGTAFFDDVRLPKAFVVAEGDAAHTRLEEDLTIAKTIVATTFVGVGRAAFDFALAHVHERRQGGAALIDHQAV